MPAPGVKVKIEKKYYEEADDQHVGSYIYFMKSEEDAYYLYANEDCTEFIDVEEFKRQFLCHRILITNDVGSKFCAPAFMTVLGGGTVRVAVPNTEYGQPDAKAFIECEIAVDPEA